MGDIQTDLLGEKRIQLKHADAYLNKIAQHIYDLVLREPELLNGNSMNRIYRQIHFAVMLDSGLLPILLNGDIEQFKAWFLSKECPMEEEVARATRELISEDFIRLPASVIKKSEQFKARIASKMR